MIVACAAEWVIQHSRRKSKASAQGKTNFHEGWGAWLTGEGGAATGSSFEPRDPPFPATAYQRRILAVGMSLQFSCFQPETQQRFYLAAFSGIK